MKLLKHTLLDNNSMKIFSNLKYNNEKIIKTIRASIVTNVICILLILVFILIVTKRYLDTQNKKNIIKSNILYQQQQEEYNKKIIENTINTNDNINNNTTKIINLNKKTNINTLDKSFNEDITREMENLTNLVELEGGSVEFYDDLLK
jgi:hypothetical protein